MDRMRPHGGAGSRRSEQAAVEARLVGGCEARGREAQLPSYREERQNTPNRCAAAAAAWEGKRRWHGKEDDDGVVRSRRGRAEGSGTVGGLENLSFSAQSGGREDLPSAGAESASTFQRRIAGRLPAGRGAIVERDGKTYGVDAYSPRI